ncbi:glycosyltransferase [Bacillus idriensis]|uniref:Glycosyltransferase n=1 Tax=Metabacillus idriensis TaxID=324768 RepID=A0A6I2M7M7_9BACI|nr:glycosyltransferase family 2 protein [Metabacillus idriensis]MRX54255.1 glycosyltransferase [Metabacillus idriensis]
MCEVRPEKILLSIIVPIYNVEKYLDDCIKSLTESSMDNIEIVLINDGSTDKSRLIMEKYEKIDNRIRCLNKKNEGLGAARNSGLEIATGKYIMFLDSDDYIKSDTLPLLLQEIETNTYDILIFNGEGFFDGNGKVCIKKYFHIKEKANFYKDSIKKYCLLDLHSACFKIQSKEFIEQNRMFFPKENYYGEDVSYWLKSIEKTKSIKYIDINVYRRRYREGSIMVNMERNSRDRLLSYGELIHLSNDKVINNFIRNYLFKWWMRGLYNTKFLEEINTVINEEEFKRYMYNNGNYYQKFKYKIWNRQWKTIMKLLTYLSIGYRRLILLLLN